MTAHQNPFVSHYPEHTIHIISRTIKLGRYLCIIAGITLSIFSTLPALADGADDYASGANPLPIDGSGSGSLDWSTDHLDYWVTEADYLGELRVTLSVPAGQDFDLYILDHEEYVIAYGIRDGGGDDESLTIELPYAGIYYVVATTWGYSAGNYTIRTYYDPDIHPDLKPTIDALNEPWEWGSTVTAEITVLNEGAEAASSFVVRLKASNDAIYGDADDYQVASWTAGPLAIGATWTKTNTWTLPGWPYGTMPSDGPVYWYAAVDPVSGETDTADNDACDQVTMSRANQEPTLLITAGPQGTITYNDVTFSYSAVDIDGAIVSYEVKLAGVTTTTNVTSVTYNDLLNGPYTFEVRAQDDDGAWSIWVSRSFTVAVDIPPPPDFTLQDLKCEPSDDITVQWEAESGYTYQLQYCDRLPGSWLNLGTPLSVTPGESEISCTDDTTANAPTRFYRVTRTPL
jgi:hypothetical protein